MRTPLRRGLTASVASALALSLLTPLAANATDAPPVALAAPDSAFVEVVGADQAHAQGFDGTGVGIAIVDTGVSPVGDLGGRLVPGANFSAEPDTTDSFGHGTFIAGVAAGDGAASDGEHAGVAPGAHIVPVKIAGRNGAADVTHVLAALEWVVSHRESHDIDVVNLSFSTDSVSSTTLDPLNFAVQRAWDAGIVVVVSAGNNGDVTGAIGKPADDPLVITVGSTESHGTLDRSDDTLAPFSSRGPTFEGLAKPDLVGPGRSLVGLRAPGSLADTVAPEARIGADYFRGSGTSFTAGIVSGAVALLLDAHPDWTPDQVKEALLDSAAPGPVGDPEADGHGALDVAAALAATPPGGSQALVTRSTGLGSIAASRGSLAVDIEVGGVPLGLAASGLGAPYTAQGQLFDVAGFLAPWTATSWQGSQWQGSQWQGSQWQGSQWQGSQWQGSQWQGSQWQGSQWQGSQWQGAGWW